MAAMNTDVKNTDVKNTDVKNTDVKNTDVKNTDVKNTDVKNTDVKNTDVKNTDVKKFALKFEGLDTTRPGVTCDSENFASVLYNEYSEIEGKRLLISHFIASQNYKSYENKQMPPIWSYNVNTKSNTTTIYAAPSIGFIPIECDLETMQAALTRAKISATFFDSQISKHLESVGIKTTRANIRAYRESYKDQISKLLLEEILSKRTIVHVVRWFDKINGDSYSSVSVFDGIYQINIPMCYGYGSAENLVIHALKLDVPSTMCPGEYLENLGMTVVDLGYKPKREMFQAAFHI